MILWIAIAFIVLYFAVGFLLPNTTTIASSLKMSHDPDAIFNTISEFRNWRQWAVWNKDNSMEIILSKQTKGQGARYRWKSKIKEIKGGLLVLTNTEAPNFLAYQMYYGRMKRGQLHFNIESLPDCTFVTCAITINNRRKIFARYMAIFIKKSIQKDIDEVLLKIDEVTI